jgi:hypothetical protein
MIFSAMAGAFPADSGGALVTMMRLAWRAASAGSHWLNRFSQAPESMAALKNLGSPCNFVTRLSQKLP